MNKIKERQSNFELLRIIAMLLIVAHHYVDKGNLIPVDGVVTLNNIWSGILYM